MKLILVLIFLLLAGSIGAQSPTADNAGFGAIYCDVALDVQTGNVLHFGVAVSSVDGHVFVSAAGTFGAAPHLLYEFDATGSLLRSHLQPAAQSTTALGMRDLEFDGQSILGGSEVGVSVCDTSGSLVNVVLAANGPQPIVQPIGGAALQQLGVLRAIAFDPAGNGGNGSLFVANFGSPILECALNGSILRTIPNGGWQAYGLALDPATRNLWVNGNNQGDLAEIDRQTGFFTGHTIASVVPGAAPGGLAVASSRAGHHEQWASDFLLASIEQAESGSDHVAIQRVRLYPGLQGYDEPVLALGVNGGGLTRGNVGYSAGDVLELRVSSAAGLGQGMPCWTIVNFYSDAATDAYTNLSNVLPGFGMLQEFRFLSAVSLPSSTTYGLFAHSIGSVVSIPLPPVLAVQGGDLLRFQSIYFEPRSSNVFAATNEGNFIGQEVERGIVVSANGRNSFQSNPALPFWEVQSDSSHRHGAILWVELSYLGATGAAASQRFDLDQGGMNDRFDGGNSTVFGAHGTYRNGCDVLCGLDYAAPGAYVDPHLHTVAAQSGGFAATLIPNATADAQTLRFAFQSFSPNKAFRFDCDTDGGMPSGDGQVGMIVRVGTANSGVLTGVLQQDPVISERAVIYFH